MFFTTQLLFGIDASLLLIYLDFLSSTPIVFSLGFEVVIWPFFGLRWYVKEPHPIWDH